MNTTSNSPHGGNTVLSLSAMAGAIPEERECDDALGIMPHVVIKSHTNSINSAAFIDSGSNTQFINTSFVYQHRHQIPTILLDMAFVEVCIGNHVEHLQAYVADLQYDLVLGRPWLATNQPYIDWATGVVALSDHCCRDHSIDILATQNLHTMMVSTSNACPLPP